MSGRTLTRLVDQNEDIQRRCQNYTARPRLWPGYQSWDAETVWQKAQGVANITGFSDPEEGLIILEELSDGLSPRPQPTT